MLFSIVANALALGLMAGVQAQEVTCWAPDGKTKANNETYVPCNKLGIQQKGVYSACCALDGKASDRDLCASTGLCLNDGVYHRGYCTDQSWDSPACVNICTDPKKGGSANGTSEITACTDGKYCCGHNNLSCCGTDDAFEIPQDASVIADDLTETVTSSPEATSSASNGSSFKNATIGLAVVLGVVALAGIGAILWLLRRNKKLKQELEGSKSAPMTQQGHTPATTYRDPYQQDPTDVGTEYTGPSSPREHWAPYKPPMSPSVPEVDGNPQRYSELDASVTHTPDVRSYSNPASPPLHEQHDGIDSPLQHPLSPRY